MYDGYHPERALPSRRVEHVRKHKQRNASLENARVNLTARGAHLARTQRRTETTSVEQRRTAQINVCSHARVSGALALPQARSTQVAAFLSRPCRAPGPGAGVRIFRFIERAARPKECGVRVRRLSPLPLLTAYTLHRSREAASAKTHADGNATAQYNSQRTTTQNRGAGRGTRGTIPYGSRYSSTRVLVKSAPHLFWLR